MKPEQVPKGGYMGKLLHVNLTSHKNTVLKLDTRLLREFLGGRGLASRLLWEYLPPRIDPFDPDNPLIITTGPFTGTLWPCSCRYTITAKSPLTFG